MKKIRIILTVMLALGLSLVGCVDKSKQYHSDYEEMIFKANDILYYGSEETGPMGSPTAVAGEISSSVSAKDVPEENGESNFGCVGNPYTKGNDDFIMVYLEDEHWHIFYAKD